MPISFNYTVPSTGAIASYHVVQQIGIDYVANLTHVSIASYISQDTYSSGKFPAYTQNIDINGLPDTISDPLATVQADLIEAEPTDGTASTLPNRYLFAGATLVD